jgi:hypothetical protein
MAERAREPEERVFSVDAQKARVFFSSGGGVLSGLSANSANSGAQDAILRLVAKAAVNNDEAERAVGRPSGLLMSA